MQIVNHDGLLAALERRLARHAFRRRLRMQNVKPMVSFTFDDVPASACERGRAILEDYGVRGTFFASGGLSVEARGRDGLFASAQLAQLHAAGHEIGSHGYAHRSYQEFDRSALQMDMRRNDEFLECAIGDGFRAISFSFPFGKAGPSAKALVADRFVAARGVQAGVNYGDVDTALLLGTPLYEQAMAAESIALALDEAWRRRGWIVFYTHDVDPEPSRVGCTPASFARVVEAVVRRGFEVLPVGGALACADGAAQCAQLPSQ